MVCRFLSQALITISIWPIGKLHFIMYDELEEP